MPKRGLEPPHLTIYAPKAYVATITPLGQSGDKETRTPDISLAKTALYQLSYIPNKRIISPNRH